MRSGGARVAQRRFGRGKANVNATRTTLWLWLTVPIAVLVVVAAGSELLVDGLFRGDTPYFVAQAIGQDFITLAVALPALGDQCDSCEPWLRARAASLAGRSGLPGVHVRLLRVVDRDHPGPGRGRSPAERDGQRNPDQRCPRAGHGLDTPGDGIDGPLAVR